MTPDEIKKRVQSEIGDRTANRFGWEFRPFLLSVPELRSYDGDLLWTILVEQGSGEGYHVVFDADMDKFGLALSGTCVGLYGGFMDTLDAM